MPRFRLLALALLLPLSFQPAPAAKTTARAAPAQAEAPLTKPALKTPSYILMDAATGKVLAERDADGRRDPASLTKMMSAYVVFSEIRAGRVKTTDLVTISKKAWRSGGSRTFLELNSKVSVDVLLRGMIIQSGNDAAIALAEHVGGTEAGFVELMNQHARALGMSNSHFTNPHGLSRANHYSSARDLAKLSRVLVRDFPQYRAMFGAKEFTWNNIRQYNRNKLLWRDPSVDGLKTGYTYKARYCQAATAERGGRRLISVLLGSPTPNSRAKETQQLLDYGFRVQDNRPL